MAYAYSIPFVQSLRALEIAAGLALLLPGNELKELIQEKIPSTHNAKDLRQILG